MNANHLYASALNSVLAFGKERGDRTGTGTVSMFGHQMRFDLIDSFPLLTCKSTHWKSIVHELLWFLKGESNIQYLKDNGVSIWDEWATKDGELGPVYGVQWRTWPASRGEANQSIDQITALIHGLKNKPFSRRHIVSAWNPAALPDESLPPQENVELGNQALPPCHAFFQFYAEELSLDERVRVWKQMPASKTTMIPQNYRTQEEDHKLFDSLGVPRLGLSCQLYQRSADMFLGVPFNIASYSLLVHMIAKMTGMAPLEFIWTGGDCHIYSNHMEQVKQLLARFKADEIPALPQVRINGVFEDIEDITFDDIELIGYNPLPAIKAPVAV